MKKYKKSYLDIKRLRDALDYNQTTGIFTWKVSTSNRAKVGSIAGTNHGNGYILISIDKHHIYAHRLAWFYVFGEWPDSEIDHADGNRANNSISNLRQAVHSENSQNQKRRSTNTSGKHGVSWSGQHGKWAAYIMVNGRKKHLGLYDDLNIAGDAYLNAKSKMHQFQPVPRDV